MNIVEPIRDVEKIEEIHSYLLERNKRNALLFSMGIYTGLRISDILKFRVADCYKRNYNIREQKTKKPKILEWNPYLYKEMEEYIQGKNPNEFLFKSRQGYNTPISRIRAYQIIKSACNACKVFDVGTHTMRKTFGYHHYQKFKDVAILQKIFNHSSPQVTLRYIGIEQDQIDESYANFVL